MRPQTSVTKIILKKAKNESKKTKLISALIGWKEKDLNLFCVIYYCLLSFSLLHPVSHFIHDTKHESPFHLNIIYLIYSLIFTCIKINRLQKC